MRRILITGANRGLGLEFTRQLTERGDYIFAGCRDPKTAKDLQKLVEAYPNQITLLALDVINEKSIDTSVEIVHSYVDSLDILINNAGIYPHDENPTNLFSKTLLHSFHVNSVAPMIVAQRFLELLKQGENPRIINISTMMGSLQTKQSGGDYSYCSSKAALNMLSRALAFDLRMDGITVIAMHPGWVQTDMGGEKAPLAASDSVRGMLKVINGLKEIDTGKFLTWEGNEHPW